MLVSTTEELQGFAITDYLGLVHGEVVSGANILRALQRFLHLLGESVDAHH